MTGPLLPGSRKFRPGEFVMVSVTAGTTRLAEVIEPSLSTLPHEIHVGIKDTGETFGQLGIDDGEATP
jgi:hypothetical protein